jgi:hypothetical protein
MTTDIQTRSHMSADIPLRQRIWIRGSAPQSEVVPGGGSHGEEEDMAGGVVVHEVVA